MPWPEGLVEAAARGGAAEFLAKMLAEPRLGRAVFSYLASGRANIFPAQTYKVFKAYQESSCWRGSLPRGTQIGMVGAYQSRARPDQARRGRGVITIRLPASSTPVLLALSAYEPVNWRIEAPRSARLAGVIAVGMYRPNVSGDLRGSKVLINDQRDHCPALDGAKLYAYELGLDQQGLASAFSTMLQTSVTDFTGSYSAASFYLE
jgi:hypothetical protein